MMHKSLLVLLLLVSYSFAFTQVEEQIDTLILKSGTSYPGTIKSQDQTEIRIEIGGEVKKIPTDAIDTILGYNYRYLDTIVFKNGTSNLARILDRKGSTLLVHRNGRELKIPIDMVAEVNWFEYTFPRIEDGSIGFSQVIEASNMSKDELFDVTKEWLVELFSDANEVIQIDDKELGKIVGKGFFTARNDVKVWFIIKVLFKENKLKVDIYNLDINATGYYPLGWEDPYKIWKWQVEHFRSQEQGKMLIALEAYSIIVSLDQRIASAKSEDDFDF